MAQARPENASNNPSAAAQVTPDFPVELTPDGLTPCICGPLVGNYFPGQIQTWFVQAHGGPLDLRLTTVTVNTNDPQSTIVDVFDGSTLLTSLNVSYTAADAAANGTGWEKPLEVSLGVQPAGKKLRLEARNGGTPVTQTHYWLKLCGARWLALDSPSFRALEEDRAAWRFVVKPGEPLVIDLDNTGIPTPATDFAWHLIDPAGTIVSAGTNAITSGPEFNLPSPAPGLWTLQMEPRGGEHYLLDKRSGADRHIYLDWHTSQRGRKVVAIEFNGRPAIGMPFEVEMRRRHSTGGGFTNLLMASQVTTKALADFRNLPNGYYDVVVRPLDPTISPVPSQLDLILCDLPVTNRFAFFQGKPGQVDFAGHPHHPSGSTMLRLNGDSLIIENLPADVSGGVQIPLPDNPDRRWLAFDFAPISLNHEGAALVFEQKFASADQATTTGPVPADFPTRSLVFSGSPDRITMTNVLGDLMPAGMTVAWHGEDGPGEVAPPAGSTLELLGTTEVVSLQSLVPQTGASRRLIGGGIKLSREVRIIVNGTEVGRGQRINWLVRQDPGPANAAGTLVSVDIRAALPEGTFSILHEAESLPPAPPAVALKWDGDGIVHLHYQPEPGLEHLIESTDDGGLSWTPVARRDGSFLPEMVTMPTDREVRLFRVRFAP